MMIGYYDILSHFIRGGDGQPASFDGHAPRARRRRATAPRSTGLPRIGAEHEVGLTSFASAPATSLFTTIWEPRFHDD